MDQSDAEATANFDCLSLGQLATLACVLEVTAPKPGNVHRGADFDDSSYVDFLASAVASGPAVTRAESDGVGEAILAAVQATRTVTPTNTNLGTILLLAPIAAIPRQTTVRAGIGKVLASLTLADTELVFRAIRHAKPGGLGSASQYDVADSAPAIDLRTAMQPAADRDLVARQYTNNFEQVFFALDRIATAHSQMGSWSDAIVRAHLQVMAKYPDSLIARKCGTSVALEAARRAKAALDAASLGEQAYLASVSNLDFWLRADHHRRNPGTTADLIAAALFIGLRDGAIQPPYN